MIRGRSRRRDDTDANLQRMLVRYSNRGVKIYLEGRPSTPQEVVKELVNDEKVFMPDYVTDMNNRLVQIRYDLVK